MSCLGFYERKSNMRKRFLQSNLVTQVCLYVFNVFSIECIFPISQITTLLHDLCSVWGPLSSEQIRKKCPKMDRCAIDVYWISNPTSACVWKPFSCSTVVWHVEEHYKLWDERKWLHSLACFLNSFTWSIFQLYINKPKEKHWTCSHLLSIVLFLFIIH